MTVVLLGLGLFCILVGSIIIKPAEINSGIGGSYVGIGLVAVFYGVALLMSNNVALDNEYIEAHIIVDGNTYVCKEVTIAEQWLSLDQCKGVDGVIKFTEIPEQFEVVVVEVEPLSQ
jgi:hypothetical protein